MGTGRCSVFQKTKCDIIVLPVPTPIYLEARGNAVVKALRYKPEGREF
jgi:hypothetical protein